MGRDIDSYNISRRVGGSLKMNELKGLSLSVESVHISFIDVPNHTAVSLFLNGCNVKCSHCHNPSLQSYKPESTKEVLQIIKTLTKYEELADTVCILGGEPLMQDNKKLLSLIQDIKKQGMLVCLYTSYEKEEVPSSILENIDMLKTGKYIRELESGGFLASANQKYFTKENGEWSQW